MKVEWLNDALTEARLTRGHLWWKRVTLASRDEEGKVFKTGYAGADHNHNWKFMPSNVWCDRDLDILLDNRRREERVWRKPSALPAARLLP